MRHGCSAGFFPFLAFISLYICVGYKINVNAIPEEFYGAIKFRLWMFFLCYIVFSPYFSFVVLPHRRQSSVV